jgi:hypothetical protein
MMICKPSLKCRKKKRSQAALRGIGDIKEPVRQQLGEKTLREILGVRGRVPATPGKSVKREPVLAAQLL